MPARKKMTPANKRKVSSVMRAARGRKPTGRKVKFTKGEKSTLREVMKSHSGSARKRKAPAKRKSPAKRKTSIRRRKQSNYQRNWKAMERRSRPPKAKRKSATRKRK